MSERRGDAVLAQPRELGDPRARENWGGGLTYLELDGHLVEGTSFYSSYQFRLLVPQDDILSNFEGERRQFLGQVFRQAVMARTWSHIDLAEAATAISQPRDRLVRALDYLAEQGWMELRATGIRNRFHRRRLEANLDGLAQTLHARAVEREERELARLHQVRELAGYDGCQVSHLGEHFGDPLDHPCDHCSWCLNGRRPASLPTRPIVPIDEALLHRAAALRADHPEVLADLRAIARLLCGVTSPKLSRARRTTHSLFGVLSQVPFADVLAALNAQ